MKAACLEQPVKVWGNRNVGLNLMTEGGTLAECT